MRDDAETPPAVWAVAGEAPRAPLQGEHICDLAIVGGGLVGLTAADVASRHGLSVMLVEGDVVGAGASGTNAAGVASVWGTQTPYGVEAALGPECRRDAQCGAGRRGRGAARQGPFGHVQSQRYVEGLLFASGGTLNPRAYVRAPRAALRGSGRSHF